MSENPEEREAPLPDPETIGEAPSVQGAGGDSAPAPQGAGAGSSAEKPPEQWVTSDEPMTGPQRSYLETLCREAGVELDPELTKAEASKRIEELQAQTGRGSGDAGAP